MIDVKVSGPFMVLIDPHHGQPCRGQHAIIVHGSTHRDRRTGVEEIDVSIGWGPVAMLSIEGALDFKRGLEEALEIAAEMKEKVGYFRHTEERVPVLRVER